MIGNTLGPYRVLDKLGEGGMGEVYSAHDTRLERGVAIKVISGPAAGDPDLRQRFERRHARFRSSIIPISARSRWPISSEGR